MLLSEFIKDNGVNKYFRTPTNLKYSLLANFIQLVLEGDWIGKLTIPSDFATVSDINKYFRTLNTSTDTPRFGDMYIILSETRYRYGVYVNQNVVIEQVSPLEPRHTIQRDSVTKMTTDAIERGYDVVWLRPLNEKNIFPSDDLRYIKQDKPFAHVTFDITTNNYTVYAPGNHVTYSNLIWGQDPTNQDIEALAKMEIYRPLWLHVLDSTKASVVHFTGTYDSANFTTWEIPGDEMPSDVLMLALLRIDTTDYITDNIKWTDKLPVRPIFYNVKDYGAVGDDTHDDFSSIVAAVTAAHNNGSGILYFPYSPAKYKITDEVALPEGVSIWGDGRHGVTIRQATAGKRGFFLTNGTGETVAELQISGFKLEMPTGSGDGIFIEGRPLDYFRVNDVTVDGAAVGVHCKGAIVSRLEGVNGQNCTTGGIWIDGTDSFVTSVSLTACYGNANTGGFGVKISKATYVSVMGGAADSNDIGHYLLDCFSATLNGTGSESNTSNNFKVEGSSDFGSTGVNLVGCYSYDVGAVGFFVTGFSTNVQLIGCIDNFPNASATYSLQADEFTVLTALGCKWSNPNNIHANSGFVELVDSDANSHMRNLNLQRLRDTNGNLILDATALTPNAVNAFQIVNAAAGHAPLFGPAGTDTDIAGYYTSKGAGAVRLAKGDGSVLFQVDADHTENTFYATPAASGQAALFGVTSDDLAGGDADVTMYLQSKGQGDIRLAQLGGYVFANFSANMLQPVNWPEFTAVNTGQAVEIGAAGGDTNIYLNLASKGTGTVRANGHDVVTVDGAANLTNKTFPNLVIDGASGVMTFNASPDASEYNIGVDTTGTLTLFGAGGEILNLEMYDGDFGVGSQDPTKGVILTSPNFNRYRVTVDNSGALVVAHI